jgi:hypothetical protein
MLNSNLVQVHSKRGNRREGALTLTLSIRHGLLVRPIYDEKKLLSYSLEFHCRAEKGSGPFQKKSE